jgi:hypothetical protein
VVLPIKFARSARKHRIGCAHAVHVITTAPYTRYPASHDLDPRIEWIGPDDRGVELEIIALELPDVVLVIHVMPIAYRRNHE